MVRGVALCTWNTRGEAADQPAQVSRSRSVPSLKNGVVANRPPVMSRSMMGARLSPTPARKDMLR